MDLRRLRYFVAVAEELHFGRAAARLHISAPPLSQRINELEAELGVRLFDRTSRRVALTPAGDRLLVEARAVLDAADRFERVAREGAAPVHPTLAVGYCHGSELGTFRLIRAFRAHHPQTPVRPDALTSLRSIDAIRTGRLTVAVVRPPIADPRALASRPMARVVMNHVAVPVGHPLTAEAGGGRRVTWRANRSSWSSGPTRPPPTTRPWATAPRSVSGPPGCSIRPLRPSGCWTWWRWAPASDG